MPRSESRTKTGIWSDGDFTGQLTMRGQRTYWMLYSQATISLCGVVALRVKRWADTAKDATVETVIEELAELEAEHYVMVDFDTEEVLVRTFARHDGVYKSNRTLAAAWQQLSWVDSARLREAARSELMLLWDLAEKEGYRTPRRPWTPVDNPVEKLGTTPETGHLDTLPDRVSDGVSDGVPDTLPDRHRARRAQSPSPSPSPSPTPSTGVPEPPSSRLTLVPQTAPDRDADASDDRDQTTPTALGHRLANACAGNRTRTLGEAHCVVQWALAYVDPAIIEHAVGWAESLTGEARPVLPRAVASTIARKARDAGIQMPAFDPARNHA